MVGSKIHWFHTCPKHDFRTPLIWSNRIHVLHDMQKLHFYIFSHVFSILLKHVVAFFHCFSKMALCSQALFKKRYIANFSTFQTLRAPLWTPKMSPCTFLKSPLFLDIVFCTSFLHVQSTFTPCSQLFKKVKKSCFLEFSFFVNFVKNEKSEIFCTRDMLTSGHPQKWHFFKN